jgi:hypothetical protein
MKDLVILCERCIHADQCMTLVPCKDFIPEQNSNFLTDVVQLQTPKDLELSYNR